MAELIREYRAGDEEAVVGLLTPPHHGAGRRMALGAGASRFRPSRGKLLPIVDGD